MNAKLLVSFLKGSISSAGFAKEIDEEVGTYRKAARVKGSSMSVKMSGTLQLRIDSDEICMILQAFFDGALSGWHIQYVCDALQMAEGVTFANEEIREILDTMNDIELDDDPDMNELKMISNMLSCGKKM